MYIAIFLACLSNISVYLLNLIIITIIGDTGYGNSVNVKRTLQGYARAGMAGIMIEDQVSPKRCGHVAGKSVVSFEEAVYRVQAACDAR